MNEKLWLILGIIVSAASSQGTYTLKNPNSSCNWANCFNPGNTGDTYDISNLKQGMEISGMTGPLGNIKFGDYAILSAIAKTTFTMQGTCKNLELKGPISQTDMFDISSIPITNLKVSTKIKIVPLTVDELTLDINIAKNFVTMITTSGPFIKLLKMTNFLQLPDTGISNPIIDSQSVSGSIDKYDEDISENEFGSVPYGDFSIMRGVVGQPAANSVKFFHKFYSISAGVFSLKQTCGNGVLDAGESCDTRTDVSCTIDCRCADQYDSANQLLCLPICNSTGLGCSLCYLPHLCRECLDGYTGAECLNCSIGYAPDKVTPYKCNPVCTSKFCDNCLSPEICENCKDEKGESFPGYPNQGCLKCIPGYNETKNATNPSDPNVYCTPYCSSPFCVNCSGPDRCENCSSEMYNPIEGCLKCAEDYTFVNETSNLCRPSCNANGCKNCNGIQCIGSCEIGYTGDNGGCYQCEDHYQRVPEGDSIKCVARCMNEDPSDLLDNPYCVGCVGYDTCTSCLNRAEPPNCFPNCTFKDGFVCINCIGKEMCESCFPAFAHPENGCNECNPTAATKDSVFPDCKRYCGDYCEFCVSESDLNDTKCAKCIHEYLRLDTNCKYCNGTSHVGRAPNCYPRRNKAETTKLLQSLVMLALLFALLL